MHVTKVLKVIVNVPNIKEKHGKFDCEECDHEYKVKGLLEKHDEAVLGSANICCICFNKYKDCPYDDQCTFAHKESPECKFGTECASFRDMSDNEDDDESEDEGDVKKDEKDLKLQILNPVLNN